MSLRLHPDRPHGPVYFLSDAHLGTGPPPAERDKEARLLAFLAEVRQKGAALVILGDLFDFWFEYRHAIPVRGFAVLGGLQRVVEAGVPVDFLGGNHDYWAGPFLERTLGLRNHTAPFETDCQGRRLFLAHGDGLAPGDLGYRLIRKVFRNRLAIAAYRLIHPDLGIPMATSSSHLSRRYTEDTPVIGADLWRKIARPQFDRGFDAVLIGHFHRPVHVQADGRDFIINGDWMNHWTYTVLEGGAFQLRIWEGSVVPPGVP